MTNPDGTSPPARRRPRRFRAFAAGLGLVLIGCLAVLYGMPRIGKDGPIECRPAVAAALRLDPLVHGEVAALGLAQKARLAPNFSFASDDGRKTLADFKGRTVLVNLWATWCVPCRKEMPALDRLQAKLGGPDFQVVAINVDTAKLDQPKAFLKKEGITSLPLYTDSSGDAFQELRQDGQALGLPTTLLLDRNGCQLGTMMGPAAWDSADAEKLIEAAERS